MFLVTFPHTSTQTGIISIRTNLSSSIDGDVLRRADLFVANLSPEDPHNYKTTIGRLLPSIYVSAIVLGKMQCFISLFTSYSFRVFSRFVTKIQNSFRTCIGTPLIYYSILFIHYIKTIDMFCFIISE